jgi:hypothetical protein
VENRQLWGLITFYGGVEMNRKEHLLTVLAEEASEVIKAVSKALRFGLKDGYPGTDRTNEQDIIKEYAQMVAVFEMLQTSSSSKAFNSEIDWSLFDGIKLEKKANVLKYMEYAKQTGALTD